MNLKKEFNKEIFDTEIDPKKGIGTEAFELVSELTPIVNVDLLIRNKDGEVLVSWRDDAVCKKGWHLPGGVLRYKETLIERVHKTAISELGIDVKVSPMPLDINEIILNQSVRGHFISFLYECEPCEELNDVCIEQCFEKGRLHWYKKGEDEPLVLGQRNIYSKYL